ncbi:hypothetical protein [Haploplasma axanthum]|uniref:Uncharacterized protein n=1 Tax=Haploplasma axanthum TaxID=29552 RepID=A0A449BB66_HAPAX|nr:hypothetical protein [Haploplasma axanthum]VEU79567.1 Uncharacterised protein [Haploplasma axanthum]
MSDNNARAPKVRSGDTINPTLAAIIKISLIAVMVALVVVVTLVIVELVKKNKEKPSIFEDKVSVTLEEFKLIEAGEYQDDVILANKKVNDILKETTDETNIFFYFYYASLEKNISKETLDLISNIEEKSPIFFVNLEADQVAPKEGETASQTFKDYLSKSADLLKDGNDISATLNRTEKDKKGNDVLVYQTFIITFNLEDKKNDVNPFKLNREDTKIIEILKDFETKTEA